MKLIPKIGGMLKKAFNNVQESQRPKKTQTYDEHRIDRELAYIKRVHQINPRLKTLNQRRIDSQKRRPL